MRDDDRLREAKAVPIDQVAQRLEIGNLVPTGGELVGPCPQCGGRDRFGINPHNGQFLCRKECGPHSRGDVIALVQHALGVDFRAALDWLVGPAQGLTDAERAKRRQQAAAHQEKQDAIAAKRRTESISSARDIFFGAQPAAGTPVADYLARRGIDPALLPDMPAAIRYQPQARYMIPSRASAREFECLHTGPAMVCAVVDAGGRVTAVHRTWIDLDQPKGKLILRHPSSGEILPAKKVLGSKKGAAIRLHSPQAVSTLIMAEGVETALSAMIAEPSPRDCAYWCGVDLGNMSGRMQRGPGLKYAGRPDMGDREAWVPPAWVRRLVFVQDGDSDPKLTRAKLEAGLRRAMIHRPGLIGQIVHAGEGRDLNDILMWRPYP